MAELQTLARPYAKAVFELARDQGTLAGWADELAAIAQVIAEPAVKALIGHPAVSRPQLADALGQALKGKLSASALAFVSVLTDNRRLGLASLIAQQFGALKDDYESSLDVSITTATPVAGSQQKQLGDAIGKRLSRQLKIDWTVDEALLGGAVVRAGDLVIDGSMRGELERLKATLTR